MSKKGPAGRAARGRRSSSRAGSRGTSAARSRTTRAGSVPSVRAAPPRRRATALHEPATSSPPAHVVGGSELSAAALAAQAGISVQLLRSYQSKGLLPPPRREGRLAWYGGHHLERLRHIRDLKDRGYSLRMIAEALAGGADESSAAAPAHKRELLQLRDVAELAQVPPELLRSMEASGLLRPFHFDRRWVYTDADVQFVRQVLVLLGVGLSLDEFVQIAHPYTEADEDLAQTTIDTWNRLVAEPIRNDRAAAGHKADRVVTSAQTLAAIVGQLVGYHVERVVFQTAQRLINSQGTAAERRALERHIAAPRD